MRALYVAFPSRSPLLPALTRSLRAASVFLTSPPQQDKRARSGTLRLYYTSKQTTGETNPETHWGTRNRPRPQENHGPGSMFPRPLLPPPEKQRQTPAAPMTTESGADPSPRRINDRGRMSGHRAPYGTRACRAAPAARGNLQASRGHPGKPPQSPGFPPVSPHPFRPLPPARGRAPRTTGDSHTAPTPAHTENSTPAPTLSIPPHPILASNCG